MKEKINTNIEMYLGDVTLLISVTKNLKREEGNLKNFGHIQVSNGMLGEITSCFWDNLEFFYNISVKKFKEDCGEKLRKGSFGVEETRKNIKRLLNRAFKLGILNRDTGKNSGIKDIK